MSQPPIFCHSGDPGSPVLAAVSRESLVRVVSEDDCSSSPHTPPAGRFGGLRPRAAKVRIAFNHNIVNLLINLRVHNTFNLVKISVLQNANKHKRFRIVHFNCLKKKYHIMH